MDGKNEQGIDRGVYVSAAHPFEPQRMTETYNSHTTKESLGQDHSKMVR